MHTASDAKQLLQPLECQVLTGVLRALQVVLNHVVLQYLPSANITTETDVLSLGGLITLTPDAAGVLTVSAPGMPAPAMVR